jgi:hypothetical protein
VEPPLGLSDGLSDPLLVGLSDGLSDPPVVPPPDGSSVASLVAVPVGCGVTPSAVTTTVYAVSTVSDPATTVIHTSYEPAAVAAVGAAVSLPVVVNASQAGKSDPSANATKKK